jgi:hypothetical protein
MVYESLSPTLPLTFVPLREIFFAIFVFFRGYSDLVSSYCGAKVEEFSYRRERRKQR